MRPRQPERFEDPVPTARALAAERGEVVAAAVAGLVTYGWGAIPATVRVGETTWTTSLFPRKGGYLVLVRDEVRQAEGIEVGEIVDVRLSIAIEEWSRAGR